MRAGAADVSDFENHLSRQLMLYVDVPPLRIRRSEIRGRDGDHREAGWREGVRPTHTGCRMVIVRQERGIQEHVTRDLPEDRVVENSVPRADHSTVIFAKAPGKTEPRGEVIV